MADLCEGFQWIGQSMATCDRCGHDLREHEFFESAIAGGRPFEHKPKLISFEEAAERMPLFKLYCTPKVEGYPMRWEPLNVTREETPVPENDEEMSIDDRKLYASQIMIQHTPANQEGNDYDRCAHCHYTRHPCVTYDMAELALEALEALEDLGRNG